MTDRPAHGPDSRAYLQRKVTFQHLASSDPATIKAIRMGIEATRDDGGARAEARAGGGARAGARRRCVIASRCARPFG